MDLPFKLLDPGAIDGADETFRVRTRHDPALRASIERSGIRAPLVVEPRGPRFRIVSGWGRWLARPEGSRVPCFVLPEGLTLEAAWEVFLRDNESWSVLEAARVMRRLEAVPGLTEERLIAEKLPLLGVHGSRDTLLRHRRLLELGAGAQGFIEDEGLPLRRASALLKLEPRDLESLIARARTLRLTFNEVCEAVEMLEEVSRRDGTSASQILDELQASASAREKEGWRRALRERRFPELSRYRERLQALEREVRFTVPVRIEWDPRLERPGIRMAVELADADALEAFAREVASNREALRRLLDVV